MTIFDTDTATLYSQGNQNIRGRIEAMDEGEALAVTLITRMEILRGRFDSILKAADEAQLNTAIERFRASEDMLNDFLLVSPDVAAAQQFSKLQKHKKTKNMRRADMPIACIALAQRALLVTRNVKD